jgi:hypothetical protein
MLFMIDKPMKDFETLPFTPDTQSLAAWLDTLAALPPANAAIQVNQIYKILKVTKIDPKLYYALLIQLCPVSLLLGNKLLKICFTENRQTPNQQITKIAKLCSSLFKQSSSSFCQIVDSKQLDQSELVFAIYYALQMFGYYLYSNALRHEMPSLSIWKKSAALYKLAAKIQIIDTQLPVKIPEFKLLNSISGVLKRNLLFSIFRPYAYSNTEIQALFLVSNQHFALVNLSLNQAYDSNFYWNSDTEPRIFDKGKNLNTSDIVFNCHNLTHALQTKALLTSLAPESLNNLILTLTGYKSLYSSLSFHQTYAYQLLLGFNVISDYLKNLDRMSKIQHHGQHSDWDMTLIPLDHEKKYHEFKKPLENPMQPGVSVELFPTANKLFSVINHCPNTCHSNDLVLIFKQQQQPKLAVIRNKTRLEHFKEVVILIEYIPGGITIHEFLDKNGDYSTLLMIAETGSAPEIFLAPGRYAIENQIKLRNGKSLTLNACLEFNKHFCRFAISFDS